MENLYCSCKERDPSTAHNESSKFVGLAKRGVGSKVGPRNAGETGCANFQQKIMRDRILYCPQV